MTSAAALLAEVALFAGLTEAQRDEVAALGSRRTYRRGHVLFSAGDDGESLLVVLAGRVKVSARSSDGGELILDVVSAGRTLGELGVLDGGPRSAEAETLEPTEILSLSREVVQQLLIVHPELAVSLLTSVAARLRRLTDVTADLVFLDLPRRVAKLLVEQPCDVDGWRELGLSQEQVAHRVGGTRQSVNSALRGFERRGWVVLSGTRVQVVGPDLARFVGVDLSPR